MACFWTYQVFQKDRQKPTQTLCCGKGEAVLQNRPSEKDKIRTSRESTFNRAVRETTEVTEDLAVAGLIEPEVGTPTGQKERLLKGRDMPAITVAGLTETMCSQGFPVYLS